MIKTYTDTACKAAEPHYPMLMRGKLSGNIYLITGAGKSKDYDAGVLLVAKESTFGKQVGEYSETWLKSALEPYNQPLTLENDNG